jgi:cell division protein FtsB
VTGQDRQPRRPDDGRSARPGAGRGPYGRPRFTGRAAILAIVLCAIALSLAYPVREYIAERRQLDQLHAQSQQLAARLRQLGAQQRALTSPAYIEQQARDRLHMCLPTQMCYEIIGTRTHGTVRVARVVMPWYSRLWSSVQDADKPPDLVPRR